MTKAAKARCALFAAAFAAVLFGFRGMIFNRLPHVFQDKMEDMSFGWYVPLFSLYVLWTERDKVRASVGAPGWGGILLALPFLAMGFLGARGAQVRLEVVAFAGLAISLAWAFWGRRTAKAVLFPALFLLFCIPLATFLDVVTVHLRIAASSSAYAILRGFGVEVVRQGTMVGAADGSFAIDIAEPCSGLRSIFALMALTAGYAYFTQPTWLRRAILFAASVPLAVLGNIMRIISICLVAKCASREFATGFYHDYSGYVVFAVAILMMVATGEGITRIAERRRGGKGGSGESPEGEGAEAEVAQPEPPVQPERRHPLLVPSLALALVGLSMWQQGVAPELVLAKAPDVCLGEVDGFRSQAEEISEAERTVLPKDTLIHKRSYTSEDGRYFLVTAVVGGATRSSIHRPELCLPAQGFQMARPRIASVAGVEWRRLSLERGGAAPCGFAYTFFNQAGFRTPSHTRRIMRDVWDRSALSRIDRWVMVTVYSSSDGDEAMADFLGRLEVSK